MAKEAVSVGGEGVEAADGQVMVGYKPGRVVGGIPCAMPGRLASWRRQGGVDSVVDWSEKYVYAEGRGSEKALTGRWRRSYTARDLELHYIRCGHRMSAKESGNVLRKAEGKYERNPVVGAAEKKRRLCRTSETTRVGDARDVPETGQALMEKYVGRRGRSRSDQVDVI